eukprot:6491726-Amphidinium_carterae.4
MNFSSTHLVQESLNSEVPSVVECHNLVSARCVNCSSSSKEGAIIDNEVVISLNTPKASDRVCSVRVRKYADGVRHVYSKSVVSFAGQGTKVVHGRFVP